MKLSKFLSRERGRAARLARALKVSSVTIHNWAFDDEVQVPAARCPEIEKETDGEVLCEELRPDVDWSYLRGTKKAR